MMVGTASSGLAVKPKAKTLKKLILGESSIRVLRKLKAKNIKYFIAIRF